MSERAWVPGVALVLAMVLWGSSFVAMKVALGVYHPIIVIFFRMSVASLLFALFWKRIRPKSYRKGDWKLMLFMGLCEPGLYFLFEAYAIRLTSASQAGMVAATLPVLVAVAATLLLGERQTRVVWFGLVLCTSGVVWLSASGMATEHAPNPALGNFLEFIAMCCAAGYIISLKKMSATYSSWFLTAVQAWVGMGFFFPLLFMPFTEAPRVMDPMAAFCIVYLGAIVSIGAYGFYNYGLSRLPAARASAFINLVPVFALLMGRALLDEVFTVQQYAASAMVLSGVIMTQASGRKPRPNAPAE